MNVAATTTTVAGMLERALFIDDTDERGRSLRSIAAEDIPWDDLLRTAEVHGVLVLVHRNLVSNGLDPEEKAPPAWMERVRALVADAGRDEVTRDRFLAAAAAAELPACLLKGAALGDDVYRRPRVRSQGDVDVLVPRDRVGDAVRAAAEAGLLPRPEQLPLWWYRLFHFHIKLHPSSALLKPLEIHWRLNAPAMLLDARPARLWKRAVRREGEGEVFALDPLDQWLHVTTHLASHWIDVPHHDWRDVLDAMLAVDAPAVRLKWILDVVGSTERLAETDVTPAALGARCDEWQARDIATAVAALVWRSPLPNDAAKRLLDETFELTGRPVATAPAAGTTALTAPPSTVLNLRPAALARLGAWIWPSHGWLAGRYGSALVMRLPHALGVILVTAAGGLSLLVAWPARILLARGRRRRLERSLRPDAVFDVVSAWRRRERKEP